ncbi:MAG: polyphosphate kinase 2 [Yoonia sp.]
MDLPFDGVISRFYTDSAPADVQNAIKTAGKGAILNPDYPYPKWMKRAAYEAEMAALQIELVRLQAWARETGERIVVVFEGRDAAGKGGTISQFRENLNPRPARVFALSKPSDVEAGQWYFQRYIDQLPTAGEIVLFDRSWYNRAVVEHVFEFCTPEAREKWFGQVNDVEKMLVDEGIRVFKIWLNVGQATQLKRFLDRESDPLKQWKLSWIDVEGLNRWDAYTKAIDETLNRTNTDTAPWTVVRSDDKRRARLNAIRSVLRQIDYAGRDDARLDEVDPAVAGSPELWHG